jgi:hypothetical protein
MSEARIDMKRNDSMFWATIFLLMAAFGKCAPDSPSNYEHWLNAAYDYKIESINYKANKE